MNVCNLVRIYANNRPLLINSYMYNVHKTHQEAIVIMEQTNESESENPKK